VTAARTQAYVQAIYAGAALGVVIGALLLLEGIV